MFKSLIYLLLLWETTRFLEMISFFDFFFSFSWMFLVTKGGFRELRFHR